MVELGIVENLQNACRLCLKNEENNLNVFQTLNSSKLALADKIFHFYQIKIAKEDILPNKICKNCLDFTENFSEFRSNVHKCESKLQSLIAAIGALGTKNPNNKSSTNGEYYDRYNNEIIPNENCEVIIVDPNQDYESSEDSFSDSEFPTTNTNQQNISSESNKSRNGDYNNEADVENNNNEMEVLGGKRNVFLCQYCDVAIIGATECASHERNHDTTYPYTCTFCPFKYSDRQALVNHVRELHHDKPFTCVICNKGFGRRSDLKKHAIVHTGLRPFSCSVCGKSFSRNTNLTKHMRIHTGIKPHVCLKCPRSFTTIADLDRHQKIHETTDKPFKCNKCGSNFSRKDKLQSHERIHLKKEAVEMIKLQENQNELNQYGGNFVPKNTTTVNTVSNNGIIGNGNNSGIICKDGTNFMTENMVISLDPYADLNQSNPSNTSGSSTDLNVSDNYEHQLQQKNIPKDIMHLAQQQQLLQQQQQQRQPSFSGSVNYPLIQNYNESQSVINETGVINQFSQQHHQQPVSLGNVLMPPPPPPPPAGSLNTLGLQKLKQTDKQRRSSIHICSICAKAFTRKRELQRHIVIHSGQKPYSCSFCGKRFNRTDKLARHEKIHREGKFPCPKCKLDFAKQESLDIHLKLHEQVEKASQPTPPEPEIPKVPNFLQSLQVGVTPQLNFYSEIRQD